MADPTTKKSEESFESNIESNYENSFESNFENIIEDREVLATFEEYPYAVRERLLFLRQLVFETASELQITDLEETLKWGEPSYITKKGSTLRIAWRKSNPKQVGMFFHCKTSLVETFKELYQHVFRFEGNRAILFDENDVIAVNELKHCIELSLTYHKVKHLPLLGV